MDIENLNSSHWRTTRIEALADAIFAIAMTLLVLELKIPDLPRNASTAEILHGLGEHWTMFVAFFMTFFLAGTFWFMHHYSFHSLKAIDGGLSAINMMFLMFVSLLPFSTAMLGAFTLRQPVGLTFYFGNQLALGVLLNLHWIYARRHKLLNDPNAAADPRRRVVAVQPVACLLAMALIPYSPQSCFTTFAFTMVLGSAIVRRWSKRR